jgi:hypothetical protein
MLHPMLPNEMNYVKWKMNSFPKKIILGQYIALYSILGTMAKMIGFHFWKIYIQALYCYLTTLWLWNSLSTF